MQKADEPKRANMLNLMDEYGITRLEGEDEAYRLAELYVKSGAIPKNFRFDAAHIAVASINRLDCILSYNFKHINRLKTKILTEKVNRAEGYGITAICTAKEVLDDEQYNEE
ncbi:MAG: hypothetical protein LBK56_00100 [Gracilibacteraceae bacterium]|nr:hypothetical protein [Gracilibacteraceae bacterium]